MDSCRTSDLLPQNSSPTCISLGEKDGQGRRLQEWVEVEEQEEEEEEGEAKDQDEG